ncbi:MAG: RCC1 domain-containing protein [Gemmatimonadales bacterium]
MRELFRWRLPVLGLSALFGAGCLGGGSTSVFTDNNTNNNDTVAVSFTAVEVGALHTCALTTAGEAYCWGSNGVGQLGTGDQVQRNVPFPVVGGLTFQQISPGGTVTCGVVSSGVSSGQVQCWGANDQGQVGLGVTSVLEVVPRVVLNAQLTTVTAGGVHACGLDMSGNAWCWGTPRNGRLGNGDSGPTPRATPDSVIGGLTFTAITAGSDHTCGLTQDLDAYCWGTGVDGQLGNGTRDNSAMPVLVSGNLQFESLDAGGEHTCGVTLDGDAYCWGLGTDGQLGAGSVGRSLVPVKVTGNLVFQSVSAGGKHSCGVVSNNDAYCWGANEAGALGDGSFTSRSNPVAVTGGISFETVDAGEAAVATASCGLSIDRIVYCWGSGGAGQLGDGIGNNSSAPRRVAGQR